MKKINLTLLLLLLAFAFSNCKKELRDPDDPNNILDLNISESFNFETSREVTISINNLKSTQSNLIKYDIYLYNPNGETITTNTKGDGGQAVVNNIQLTDKLSDLAASYVSAASNFNITLTVPEFYNSLYIVKNNKGVFSSVILPVNSTKLSAVFVDNDDSFKSTKATKASVDMIYGVNGSSTVYSINTSTGELALVSTIPAGNGGSYACAIDPINKILYAVGLNSPYNLLAYNLNSDTWSTKGQTGFFGPRLVYNTSNGLLYYSYEDRIALVDPSNAKTISTYSIRNLDSEDGGDISLAADGTIYLSTASGIYQLSVRNKSSFNATKVSGSLTGYPSAMAFGTDNTLWFGSNISGKGRIFTYNLSTSTETAKFSNFDHNQDDFDILNVDIVVENDADNDGVIDLYDEYPNDATKATNIYTPSQTGLGTYAFEDLWPYQGDYDFNDLVVNYRYNHVLNAAGLVVETNIYLIVKNVGGSFKNGFGIELDVDKNQIQQVTGYNLTEGIISLTAQGIENNQAKSVIIAFDNSHNALTYNAGLTEILVKYTQPVQASLLSTVNPFIFVNLVRGREVHLPDNSPTSLATASLIGTGHDNSIPASGRYYKNISNLPWAINIIQDFEYPKEKSPIIKGYLKFAAWAESSGVDFPDWFIERDGYRDNTYIELD